MSSVEPGITGGGVASVATPSPRTQQTLLFPTLVRRLGRDRRLSILEIGPALPETIEFFSGFRCRLHCAAMYTDPILQMQSGDASEADMVGHLQKSFSFAKGTCFDLCLFWDFLNYLNDRALQAFDKALGPYLYKGTRAHAFTLRTLDTSFANQQYGIREEHMFSIRPRSGAQPKTFPHTQAILVNLLTGFDIDQGMLLPDGRLEVLLSARNNQGEQDSG
ncbi:MAG: hypothetical protein PVF46_08255 [Lysobacterales bacterium]